MNDEATMKFRAQRHPCSYRSELMVGATQARVRLRDVTPNGARVECRSSSLRTDDKITLWIIEHPLVATIRWARGPMIGVQFTRALSQRELSILRHMPAWQKTGQPQRRQIYAFAEL